MRKLAAVGVVAICVAGLSTIAFLNRAPPEHAAFAGSATLRAAEISSAGSEGPRRAPPEVVSLPPADTPVVEVFRQLEAAALRGSPNAACRIAQTAWRCAMINASVDMAEVLAGVPLLPNADRQVSIPESLLDQADADSEVCEGYSREASSQAYRFQQIAADRGGTVYERWLVVAPTLRQDNFLTDIEGWANYKNRADRYVRRAIASKNADELLLLLAIYAPNHVRRRSISPPYHVEDSETFLALTMIAEKSGLVLPPNIQLAASTLRNSLDSEELAQLKRRTAELSDGWSFVGGAKKVSEVFSEQQSSHFCQ